MLLNTTSWVALCFDIPLVPVLQPSGNLLGKHFLWWHSNCMDDSSVTVTLSNVSSIQGVSCTCPVFFVYLHPKMPDGIWQGCRLSRTVFGGRLLGRSHCWSSDILWWCSCWPCMARTVTILVIVIFWPVWFHMETILVCWQLLKGIFISCALASEGGYICSYSLDWDTLRYTLCMHWYQSDSCFTLNFSPTSTMDQSLTSSKIWLVDIIFYKVSPDRI